MDGGDEPQHGHRGHHDGQARTAPGDQHLHASGESSEADERGYDQVRLVTYAWSSHASAFSGQPWLNTTGCPAPSPCKRSRCHPG